MEKKFNQIKHFNYVDTVNTFRKVKVTTPSASLSSYQTSLSSAPHSDMDSCGEMGKSVGFRVLHLLWNGPFSATMIIHLFHIYVHEIAENLAFFCSFCKILALGQNFSTYLGRSWLIRISTVPESSLQMFGTTQCFFSSVCTICRMIWVSLITPINKKLIALLCFHLAARYPLQCQTYCFKKAHSWKRKVERVLQKGKRVCQSRDEAIVTLILL